MSRLVIEGISQELKAKFKAVCAVHNITMSDFVLEKVQEYVDEWVTKNGNGTYKVTMPAFIEQEDGSFIPNPNIKKLQKEDE